VIPITNGFIVTIVVAGQQSGPKRNEMMIAWHWEISLGVS
jgi:hypothetical protein